MSPAQIRTTIESLDSGLQEKLQSLPSNASINDFTPEQQDALVLAFGADWTSILGIR